MLVINYKNGRGKLQIDLEQLLPCSVKDFKKLLSFVSLSSDPAGNADEIYSFISRKIEMLKKQKVSNEKEAGKIKAAVKKYMSHATALAKLYGTPEIQEKTEKPQKAKQEEKKMPEVKKSAMVEYSITESGSVLMFVVLSEKPDGRQEKQRIKFAPDHPDYNAVLAAAVAHGCKRPENISAAAPKEAADPKQARGPVPEKTFIGQVIQGNGWKICFDGITERTRVIFSADPTDAARAAVENAGFYYSPNMNSWNKKLTFKAYRAAQKLAQELTRVCGNAA